MKVIINNCYGGFGLSDQAYRLLIKRGMKKTIYNAKGDCDDPKADIVDSWDATCYKEAGKYKGLGGRYSFVRDSFGDHGCRTDPRVIGVVEELGKKANGQCADLKIVEVPDDVKWDIEEYDGWEHIAETHRTWG